MRIALLAALAVCALPLTAQAHAHLVKADPANGAVLAAAPARVALTLSEPAHLTAAWVQRGTEPRQKLEAPAQSARDIVLALPALTSPGPYTVSWRALSEDGHVTSGTLRFTLRAPPHPTAK